MSKLKRKIVIKQSITTILLTTLIASVVQAVPHVAFPGKYKATLMGIEAANIVTVYADVASGYPRSFRVTIPGIAIPLNFPKAPACHTELVQRALSFTNEFLAKAQYLEVRDIKMENTGKEDAITNIYTNKGTLGSALKSEGLARPSSTKLDKPWC